MAEEKKPAFQELVKMFEWWQVLLLVVPVAVLLFWLFCFLFPSSSNYLFYQKIILNSLQALSVILGGITVFCLVVFVGEKNTAGAIVWGALGFFLAGFIWLVPQWGSQISLYNSLSVSYPTTKVETLEVVRLTPPVVAKAKMEGKMVNSATQLSNEIFPVEVENDQRYVAQLEPANPWSGAKGWVVYDEKASVVSKHLANQAYTLHGWFAFDPDRAAYARDWWGINEPHIIKTGKGEDDFSLVFSKEKYDFFHFRPYWADVVVIHGDGSVEEVRAADVVKDPRFIGQRVFSKDLADKMKNALVFRKGIIPGIFPWNDVHFKLPSEGEWPMQVSLKDESTWYYYPLESRNGKGLVGQVFINATSGQIMFYDEVTSDLTGPDNLADVARNSLPGFTWEDGSTSKNDSSSSKVSTLLGGAPIFHREAAGDIVQYYIYQVTGGQKKAIQLWLVGNPKTLQVARFNSPEEVLNWVRSDHSLPTQEVLNVFDPSPSSQKAGSSSSSLDAAKLQSEIEGLKKALEENNKLLKQLITTSIPS
jgi:hypothetical protein